MAILHRSLLSWMVFLVFIIFLVLRLEKKVEWRWFIVFIPMWLFDGMVLIYVVFHMITHLKNNYDRYDTSMPRKVYFLIAILLKLTFQVLLCIRLDYVTAVSLYYVMIPFWILIVGLIVDIFRSLIPQLQT